MLLLKCNYVWWLVINKAKTYVQRQAFCSNCPAKCLNICEQSGSGREELVMGYPLPCCPVIHECPGKENPDRKKMSCTDSFIDAMKK